MLATVIHTVRPYTALARYLAITLELVFATWKAAERATLHLLLMLLLMLLRLDVLSQSFIQALISVVTMVCDL
jgi:hypothetical protein